MGNLTPQSLTPKGVPDASHVVIVGGGLAGLAAAIALGTQNISVEVLESRPRLGGRASSFLDKASGEEIDNCQHVSLGCCTNYIHFLTELGLSDQLQYESEYLFVDGPGKFYPMWADPVPPPFHLLRSFLGLKYLSWSDRIAIARGLWELAAWRPEKNLDRSFADWLKQSRQPENVICDFWNLVIVSALSESLDRVSLKYARKVFVDTFLRNPNGMKLLIPKLPLSKLYAEKIVERVEQQGGKIQLQTGVKSILLDPADEISGPCQGVLTRQGQKIRGTHYILALPWYLIPEVLPPSFYSEWKLPPDQWDAAPISSVHLWFNQSVIPVKHAVLLRKVSQWLFNRQALDAEQATADTDSHYYQIVISQSRELDAMSQEQIVQHVLAELHEIWPAANAENLLRGRVVTEHRAVYSPLPGIDAQRPETITNVPNLFLAGDWIQTGWPATMEGAVRSGYQAAEAVLQSLGKNVTLIQPDLSCSIWSKVLLGLK
jgi:squalene-associated FAD-dependent desaturase